MSDKYLAPPAPKKPKMVRTISPAALESLKVKLTATPRERPPTPAKKEVQLKLKSPEKLPDLIELMEMPKLVRQKRMQTQTSRATYGLSPDTLRRRWELKRAAYDAAGSGKQAKDPMDVPGWQYGKENGFSLH